MTTLALPGSLPHMGRIVRRGGVGLLAAVLAAGAVVGTVAAERATVGHTVAGLGKFEDPQVYCQERGPLTAADNGLRFDSVTVWVTGYAGLSTEMEQGPYNMHNAVDVSNLRSTLDSSALTVTRVKLCWEGK